MSVFGLLGCLLGPTDTVTVCDSYSCICVHAKTCNIRTPYCEVCTRSLQQCPVVGLGTREDIFP
eukprot:2567553-Prymnesium_polylepis.2